MTNIRSVFLWFLGPFISILVLIKGIVLARLRFRGRHASSLFDLIAEGKKYVLHQEICEAGLPRDFMAYCYINGICLAVMAEERLLRAGFQGTDVLITVTLFRWQAKRLLRMIEMRDTETEDIAIYILKPWDADKIGTLETGIDCTPLLHEEAYSDIEMDVVRVLEERARKTGAILYGPPGNGKSYLVRYFSLKYSLPIYICSFTPDLNNHSVIKMFSQIKGPAIVLLEDFDSYFHHRKCRLKDAQFTFDTILNVLDGTFATHRKLVFFMTVNEIEQVDPALKNRPSRFRFVREIGPPDVALRAMVLDLAEEDPLVQGTEGLNLDTLLLVRDELRIGKKSDLEMRRSLPVVEKPAIRNMEITKSDDESKGPAGKRVSVLVEGVLNDSPGPTS